MSGCFGAGKGQKYPEIRRPRQRPEFGLQRGVGDFLAILVQGADMAEDRVLSHLPSFLNSSSIGNDSKQGQHGNLVATFGELLVNDGVAILGREVLLGG